MKTVFILGAGASAAAGAPLMANFLSRARGLHAAGKFPEHDKEFKDVFRAADSDLRDMYAKTHLPIHNNIEELFSAVDMGQLIGRFGRRTQEEIATLRNSIVTFIYRTIEETVILESRAGRVRQPAAYDQFAKAVLDEAKMNAGRSLNISFISFNYDVCLEYTLGRVGIGVDYGLPEPFAHPAARNHQIKLPLLKLHGSINWGWCRQCRTIVPTHTDSPAQQRLHSSGIRLGEIAGEYKLILGSELSGYEHSSCGSRLYNLPFIVPPTWNKSGNLTDLAGVWRRAAEELASADNIVVIGYSFPQTDTFFKYLYALGVNSETRLSSVTVINGPAGKETQENFARLKGVVSGDVFRFHDLVFSGAAHIIRGILGVPN